MTLSCCVLTSCRVGSARDRGASLQLSTMQTLDLTVSANECMQTLDARCEGNRGDHVHSRQQASDLHNCPHLERRSRVCGTRAASAGANQAVMTSTLRSCALDHAEAPN